MKKLNLLFRGGLRTESSPLKPLVRESETKARRDQHVQESVFLFSRSLSLSLSLSLSPSLSFSHTYAYIMDIRMCHGLYMYKLDIYANVNACVYTCVHMCVCVDISVCIYTFTCAWVYISVQVLFHTHAMHRCFPACTYVHIQYRYRYMHTCWNMYTDIC